MIDFKIRVNLEQKGRFELDMANRIVQGRLSREQVEFYTAVECHLIEGAFL